VHDADDLIETLNLLLELPRARSAGSSVPGGVPVGEFLTTLDGDPATALATLGRLDASGAISIDNGVVWPTQHEESGGGEVEKK
jgi:hypothetical protein